MKIIIIVGLLIIQISLKAQINLPYFTGFDNITEQTGWTEFKKAATTFSHWSYISGGYSLPNCLEHSFSPSTGITLTDNWFVSPEFSITNGGKIDSIRYKFSGFSQPDIGDTIAIYLLNGSQDPAIATKILLLDFRGNEYTLDETFRIKENIILPPFIGESYLAIRYRNSDCSSNWLTVNFDNLAISGNSLGIDDLNKNIEKAKIYPIPAKNEITVECNSNIMKKVIIYNLVGETVYMSYLNHITNIDISDFPNGIYFLRINNNEETIINKFIKG